MKLIYVAGKFRAKTEWEIQCNVHTAEILGHQIAMLGFMPIIPHANTRFFHDIKDDKFWLDGTLEILRRCDAVAMVHNWRDSEGATGERNEAINLKIPVFYSIDDIKETMEK